MKSLLLVLVLCACANTFFAQTPQAGDCVRREDIYHDAQYAHPLLALNQVVAEKAPRTRNTFYISPVCYFDNGFSHTVVYWREGQALILWEPDPTATKERRRHELVWSRRFWLLDKDVVPTLTEVAGSNYLLTEALARRDIRDCVRHGRKFVIYKRNRRHWQQLVGPERQEQR